MLSLLVSLILIDWPCIESGAEFAVQAEETIKPHFSVRLLYSNTRHVQSKNELFNKKHIIDWATIQKFHIRSSFLLFSCMFTVICYCFNFKTPTYSPEIMLHPNANNFTVLFHFCASFLHVRSAILSPHAEYAKGKTEIVAVYPAQSGASGIFLSLYFTLDFLRWDPSHWLVYLWSI